MIDGANGCQNTITVDKKEVWTGYLCDGKGDTDPTGGWKPTTKSGRPRADALDWVKLKRSGKIQRLKCYFTKKKAKRDLASSRVHCPDGPPPLPPCTADTAITAESAADTAGDSAGTGAEEAEVPSPLAAAAVEGAEGAEEAEVPSPLAAPAAEEAEGAEVPSSLAAATAEGAEEAEEAEVPSPLAAPAVEEAEVPSSLAAATAEGAEEAEEAEGAEVPFPVNIASSDDSSDANPPAALHSLSPPSAARVKLSMIRRGKFVSMMTLTRSSVILRVAATCLLMTLLYIWTEECSEARTLRGL